MALQLLHDMPGRRLLPDTITCSAAISVCEQAGRWQPALRLLRDMPDPRLLPGTITCSTASSQPNTGAFRTKVQLALRPLHAMPDRACCLTPPLQRRQQRP